MTVPGIVQEALEGEGVEARIALGGEDELFVTPTRTLIYRGEGLLRDESVEEYSHDAECLRFSEGRRKTRITLEYAIEGQREFTVPSDAAEEAFESITDGVLTANGVLDADESVIAAYRFSELTLIVAERRLVKHIGEAVFDEDFEEYRFEDVTDLAFETGDVAMQVVLTVDGRSERIKAPSDRGPEVRTRLENALWDYYGVGSNEELRAVVGEDDGGDPGGDTSADADDDDPFGSGLDSLGVGGDEDADADDAGASETVAAGPNGGSTAAGDDGQKATATANDPLAGAATGGTETDSAPTGEDTFEEAGFEPADSEADLAAEIAELRETVERQNQLLAKQQRTIEQLVEELSRGR